MARANHKRLLMGSCFGQNVLPTEGKKQGKVWAIGEPWCPTDVPYPGNVRFGCSAKAFRPCGKRNFIKKPLVFPFRLKTASWWLVRCVPKCVLWLQCEAHFLIGSDYGGITLICFAMTWMNMKICRDYDLDDHEDLQGGGWDLLSKIL